MSLLLSSTLLSSSSKQVFAFVNKCVRQNCAWSNVNVDAIAIVKVLLSNDPFCVSAAQPILQEIKICTVPSFLICAFDLIFVDFTNN